MDQRNGSSASVLLEQRRSHPAVSHLVRTLVEEVLSWQGRSGVQRIPSKYHDDSEERNLGIRFAKVLLRRDKALGPEPSRVQLSTSEVVLVNSVPGVPLQGCSASGSSSSSVSSTNPASQNSSSGVAPPAKRLRLHSSDGDILLLFQGTIQLE